MSEQLSFGLNDKPQIKPHKHIPRKRSKKSKNKEELITQLSLFDKPDVSSKLIYQVSGYQKLLSPTERKKTVFAFVEQWKHEEPSKKATNYISAVIKFCERVDYDLTKLSNEIVESVCHDNWSKRNIWPKTALNKFLEWLSKQPDNIFKIRLLWQKSKIKFLPLDPNLEKEILTALNNRVSRLTDEVIDEGYRLSMLKAFKVFNTFVAREDAACPRDSLKCFTKTHVKKLKLELDKATAKSPFTKGNVSRGYLSSITIHVRNVFTYAEEGGIIDENPFQGMKLPKHIHKQESEDYLSEEQIACLVHIDKEKLSKMNIVEKFQYLLPKVMVKICYEIAARSCEIVRLCKEDIGAPRHSGLVGITVVGGKHRPLGFKETVWIQYEKVKSYLALWLSTLDEYYKSCGTPHLPVDIPRRKGKGTLLFVNPDFSLINHKTTYRSLFAKLMEENNMPEDLWTRTHLLRISRITNWVTEGWEFYNVHKNARHRKYEETESYFKGKKENRARRIEENLGLNKSIEIQGFVLPDENVREFIVHRTLEEIRNDPNFLDGDFNEVSLVKEIDRSILRNVYNAPTTRCYTLKKLQEKWGLHRTQAWNRVKYLKKEHYVHPTKDKSGRTVISAWEIDKFDEGFVELPKAAAIIHRTTRGKLDCLRKLAEAGKIAGVKVGRLWFLNKSSFIDYFGKK